MKNIKLSDVLKKAKPYLAAILLRFLGAPLVVIAKIALNHGMSPFVYSLYRYFVSAIVVAPFALLLDRKRRPQMTWPIFAKILLLGSMDCVVLPNMYFSGLKYVTPTFSIAMSNAAPALSFFFAVTLRMEKVDIRRFSSQVKILGTVVAVGGAMIMTFFRGPNLRFPWTKLQDSHNNHHSNNSTSPSNTHQDSFKGVILVTISCLCSSLSCILQAVVLKSYPVGLSVTVLVSLVGVVGGAVAALAMEWNNSCAWAIHFDFQLLAILYAGTIISGLSYYVQGVVMEEKGPVFLTAFVPLGTVMVAIISSFAVSEILSLEKVLGGVVIVVGLYLVMWGKTKDSAIVDKAANNSSQSFEASDHHQDDQRLKAADGVARAGFV
ncbi:WAT1-related protein At2g39510-like [Momordica charantia]|uniref:WAT1-related protein n=1 Tax=Momordica charantia TaxID=3673 RepID=A0A6J1BZJ0_MOMCH|nr:WAT1-related protein At2g39510-like [Momordica charantia]